MTENVRYDRTFGDLQDFFNWMLIERKAIDLRGDYPLSLFSILAGGVFFGLRPVDIYNRFRSNRYFLDAINLTVFPAYDELVCFYEKINENLPGIIADINNLAEEFHSFKSLRRGVDKEDYAFLEENGWLVIPDVVPDDVCERLKLEVLAAARYEDSTGRGYRYGSGRMQRVYHLVSRAEIFREIITSPTIHEVMSFFFRRPTFHEKYYLTSFHANILGPGAERQIWHIDANVPEPIPPWIIRANSNIITDDVSALNGATEIIPGSHKWMRKPKLDDQERDFDHAIPLEAKRGSIVFWHGHLWHRSGRNSSSQPRIALLGAYSSSVFREVCMEENPYLTMPGAVQQTLNPTLKRILGWEHGVKLYSG
jgi:ectoine hydroxylase-related dioxygenase (phytanoyl-CoA dioxygenase family)